MSGRAGQRVLVTGASSGIGRAVALELGRRHARLILVARREDRLRCVAEEITMLGAPNPIVTVADLAERGAAARVGRDALDWLGGLDVLINNAGGGVDGAQVMVADRDEASRPSRSTSGARLLWPPRCSRSCVRSVQAPSSTSRRWLR